MRPEVRRCRGAGRCEPELLGGVEPRLVYLISLLYMSLDRADLERLGLEVPTMVNPWLYTPPARRVKIIICRLALGEQAEKGLPLCLSSGVPAEVCFKKKPAMWPDRGPSGFRLPRRQVGHEVVARGALEAWNTGGRFPANQWSCSRV